MHVRIIVLCYDRLENEKPICTCLVLNARAGDFVTHEELHPVTTKSPPPEQQPQQPYPDDLHVTGRVARMRAGMPMNSAVTTGYWTLWSQRMTKMSTTREYVLRLKICRLIFFTHSGPTRQTYSLSIVDLVLFDFIFFILFLFVLFLSVGRIDLLSRRKNSFTVLTWRGSM